ncbi:MAG: hypothetical protein V4697_01035 [Patescibacteria group bacterium]
MNKTLAEEIIIVLLVLIISVTAYFGFGPKRHVVYIETVPAPTVIQVETKTPSNAFSSTPNSAYSNVVGYFAYGAFVTELPDWLSQNWMSPKTSDDTTVFVPRVNSAGRDFSDIVITSKNTDELWNAEYLFEDNIAHAQGEGTLVNSEIILNETSDMRIYHIERAMEGWVYALYYIDGDGKTAEISFSAQEANYFNYSSKVKEFIQGLSKGSEPRG